MREASERGNQRQAYERVDAPHQHKPKSRHALRAGTMDKIEQCVTDVAAIDAEADD